MGILASVSIPSDDDKNVLKASLLYGYPCEIYQMHFLCSVCFRFVLLFSIHCQYKKLTEQIYSNVWVMFLS
jgi:hypothetical protein